MAKRSRDLIKQSQATRQSAQATLQRTAPKATLGGIRQAAEKKFGNRKNKKQVQPKQPKQQQPKKVKQPKPKSVSSRPLDQWQMAMEKANIPKHRWKKIADKISRISGSKRKEIEKELFDHAMFNAVYEAGDEKGNEYLVDDYLSDLEDKVNDVMNEINNLSDMVDDVNDFIQENPTLGAVVVTYVIGGNTMNFKATQVEDGSYVFEDEKGTIIAGFNSTELDEIEQRLVEDAYKVMNNEDLMSEDGLKPFKPMSPDEFKKALEEFNKNNKKD